MSIRRAAILTLVPLMLLAACSSDDAAEPTTTAATGGTTQTVDTTTPAVVDSTEAPPDTIAPMSPVVSGEAFPADRCEANKAAGTITLPVQLRLLGLCVDRRGAGRQAEGLLRRPVPRRRSHSRASRSTTTRCSPPTRRSSRRADRSARSSTTPAERSAASSPWPSRADRHRRADRQGRPEHRARGSQGQDHRRQGSHHPVVAAMLKQAGLTEGTTTTTVHQRRGFDPKVHIEIPDIVGFPGFKSNEPLQLRPPASRSSCSTPPTTPSPAASACSTPTPTFLADLPTPPRTSCAPR